jgi:histidinol-phosphatase
MSMNGLCDTGWGSANWTDSVISLAMNSDLAFAQELADLADSISLPRFGSADLVVETKPDLTPVTEADRAVERAIRDRIAGARPGEDVIGEEFGAGASGAAGRWIVDPIDGTKNYLRGIPVWATLLAMERDGEVELALVSAPGLGHRWWAVRGEGAFVDGRPIRVSGVSMLEDAQLCFGGLRTWRKYGLLDNFLALAARCWRTRGFGDFWMHMLVAEGSADIATEMEVSLWDLASVKLIVEEAGGRFTDLAGQATPSGGTALSTNGLLHEEALGILRG